MATHAVESALETSLPARRRRVLPIILATTAALALGAFAFAKWRFARVHVTTDNAQVDGHITVISPRVQAFVSQVRVDDNQRVNQGDTLVVLDDRDLRVREDQAKADLASAIAAAGSHTRGGQAQAQLAWSEAQASSAQANVASAEAAARKAAADLERMKVLAQERIVPAQQLDESEAAADAAKANLAAVQKQASAAQSQVSAYGAAVTGANARLQSAQSAVDNAQLQRSYTVITAPNAGIVAKRSVEPGALVSVGQGLMQLIPESDVWVTANLKETQIRDVNPGDQATFKVDAYPGHTYYGHVESLSPATGARFSLLPPDNATGNFTKVVQRVPVRISVDSGADPEHPLRPGMSVEATIQTR
jgi:membrane fusion protein (multidrug efflux system)